MKASLVISVAFVLGCGDDLNGASPRVDAGGGEADAGLPDARPVQCPDPQANEPGASCAEDTDCDSAEGAGDGRCLRGDKRGLIFPDTGYCVRICADDATDCGPGTVCISQESFPNALCMDACCFMGDPVPDPSYCGAGLACTDHIAGELVNARACLPGDETAAIGTPCSSNAECPPAGTCELDQSGTTGVCGALGCDVDDEASCADDGGGDGTCAAGDPPHCVDPCQTTGDCQAADGQRCDPEDMFCRHSLIGDPCEADGECGQTPWSCSPGGTCTIPCGDGCPDGTVCNEGDGCEPA